jgi:hypothetical protein
MTDLQTKTPGKRGRVLLINGVSVAVDETTREVTESQGLPNRGPAREIRAVAADSGPTPTILRSVAQTDSFGLCASLELLGFHGYCDDFGGLPACGRGDRSSAGAGPRRGGRESRKSPISGQQASRRLFGECRSARRTGALSGHHEREVGADRHGVRWSVDRRLPVAGLSFPNLQRGPFTRKPSRLDVTVGGSAWLFCVVG